MVKVNHNDIILYITVAKHQVHVTIIVPILSMDSMSYTHTVFTRIVATATINFTRSSIWLLIEAGY